MKLPIHYPSTHYTIRKKVREKYVKLQSNKCYHCGGDLDSKPVGEIGMDDINQKLFPYGFFRWPIHLHHDHDSGMTIGAVHNLCNAILWQYHGE